METDNIYKANNTIHSEGIYSLVTVSYKHTPSK